MNDDIKKEIEEKALEYSKNNNEEIDGFVGGYIVGGYTAGAKEFYNKAVEDCIKILKHNMDETIQENMDEFHESIKQLKLEKKIKEL